MSTWSRSHKRVADRVALGGKEGEAHPAADHEAVDHVEEGVDHAELVADLGAAEDGDEGSARALPQAGQHLDLAGQQASGGGRHGAWWPDDRGVGAMGGAERIVHVGVHPLDQPGDEGGVVGLLTGIEPEVLEQLRPGCQLGEPGPDGIHRVPGIRLPLRSAEVAGAHHRRPPILQPGDGGEGGADAEVVGDLVTFQRAR